MGKSYDLGPRIGIEGEEDFRKAILNTQTVVNTLGLEMISMSKQFDKNDKSVENLTGQNKILNRQIAAQKEVLDNLNTGLEYAEKNYGENDRKTQQWKQSVIRAEMKLRELEKTVKDNNEALIDTAEAANDAAAETDNLGDKSEKTNGKFKGFLKSLGSNALKGAANIIKGIGAAASAAYAGMVKLVDSTREYRTDLSKLEQNAKNANQDFEEMKGHVDDLVAITGELDSSVEAVSNLMATGMGSNEIEAAVNALSGAVIKFPDTLKIEGLADGLQETLATGQAIGPFAELIERMGGNLEDFNAQMAGATTEAEKQQVALKFLADSGLADVNAEYREANENMLAAAEAQQRVDDAMAGLAAVVEPTVTSLKTGAADVLTSVIGMVTGAEGAEGDFTTSIDNLVNTVLGQIDMLIPAISIAAQTIIPSLISGVVNSLPALAASASGIIDSILSGISDNLDLIIDAALSLTETLITGLLDNLPIIAEGALTLVLGLAAGLGEYASELIPAAVQTVLTLISGLLSEESIKSIVDAATQLVIGISQGLILAFPLILDQGPVLINNLIQGIVAAIPLLVDMAISVIEGIVGFLTDADNLAMMVSTSIELILALAAGLIEAIPELVLAIPEIIVAIVDSFLETDWEQLGKDILAGIGEGIVNSAEALAESAKQAAANALDSVKKLLDINSPSGVMRDEVGLMMGYGIAEGLMDSGHEIEYALNEVTRHINLDANFGSDGSYGDSYDYSNTFKTEVNVNDGSDGLEWERKVNAMIRKHIEQMLR